MIGSKKRYALGVDLLIASLALGASSCGDAAPGLEEGNPEQVVKRIQRAGREQDWKNWHAFCRSRWHRVGIDGAKAARLILESTNITAETRTFARIVNVGSDPLAHGGEPFVDRLVDEHWYPQRFVRDGTGVGFNLARYELKSQRASGCIEIPISETWRPGLYRVRFSLESWDDRGSSRTIRPAAYFRVAALASEESPGV